MKRTGLVSALFVRRRNPFAWILALSGTPIDARVLLAACALLSFMPITLGYVVEHNVLTSIAQSSTQILLISLVLLVITTGRVGFRWDTGAAISIALTIGASQLLGVLHSPSSEKNYVMPAAFPLFLLVGPIAKSFATRIRLEENGEYVGKVVRFLLGFFCVECVTRYALSPLVRTRLNVATFGVEHVDADVLYRYKQSIFFSDSNSTGLALLCLIAALLVFRHHISKAQIILAYALLIATLSRASIAAGFCQLIIYWFWRQRRWVLTAMAACAPVLMFLLLTAYTSLATESVVSIDGSLASKVLVLQRMIDMYSDAGILQRMVGIGVGNTEGMIGIAAHTLVATFVLELGVVGSALICMYVFLVCRRSPKTFYLLVVPIIVNGFSLILPSMPFFYITLGALSVVKTSRMEPPAKGNVPLRVLTSPLWTIRSALRTP